MTVIGLDTEHSKGRKVSGVCKEIICRMLPEGEAATELNIKPHLFVLKTILFFPHHRGGKKVFVHQKISSVDLQIFTL